MAVLHSVVPVAFSRILASQRKVQVFEKKVLEMPVYLQSQTAEWPASLVGRLTKLHGARGSCIPAQSCTIAAVLSSGCSLVPAPGHLF